MTPPSKPPLGGDWPAQLTGRIESAVSLVRDKTTKPATVAARGVVYGLVAGVLAVLLALLLIIGLVRLIEVYPWLHPRGRRVWIADAVASAIFLGSGAFVWSRRRPRGA